MAKVKVSGGINAVMTNLHHVPCISVSSHLDDFSVTDGMDRSADRCCIIDTIMWPSDFQDGMQSGMGESGTDPGEPQRSLQKCFFQALTIGVVIALFPILNKGYGIKLFAGMFEPGCIYFPQPDRQGINILLFIHHLELISLLQPEEIDAPGKNLRELNGQDRIYSAVGHGIP